MIIIVGDGQRPATLAYATWSIMALLTICSVGFLSPDPEEQREIFNRFGLSPPLWIDGNLRATFVDVTQFWQMISASLVQPGFFTLLGNLALLWVVGDDVEHAIGRFRFVILFSAGCILGLLAAVVSHSQSLQPMLGAFGGVGAVLGAFVMYRPRTHLRIHILGREFQIRSWAVLLMWLLLAPFGILIGGTIIDKPIATMVEVTLVAGVLTGVFLAPLLWRDKSALLSELVTEPHRAKANARAISMACLALLVVSSGAFALHVDREKVAVAAGTFWFERAERVVVRTATPGPIVRKWLEAAIELGNARAAATLGWMLESPRYSGLEADPERAAQLYATVIRWGASDEMANLLYARLGFGLFRDDVRWVRPAAELGDARAQHIVAVAYRYALGMPPDIERARYWARRAAAQGYEDAIRLLAELDAASR